MDERHPADAVPYPSSVVRYSTGTVQCTWKCETWEQYDALMALLHRWAEPARLRADAAPTVED